MVTRFRLNRYNWFGQKLLVQHEYDEILNLHSLHQQLATPRNQQGAEKVDASKDLPLPVISEHLVYLRGLALMKSGQQANLDEIILALQGLNFDRNPKYLLLLTQCLLYSGNFDSVVALCKQIFNRELSSNQPIVASLSQSDLVLRLDQTESPGEHKKTEVNALDSFLDQENHQFRKTLSIVSINPLINDPKLWLVFAQSLEFQLQLKDAHFAYKMAANLVSGEPMESTDQEITSRSNHYAVQVKFAHFSAEVSRDYRSAIETLVKASKLFPQNYSVNSLLALLITLLPPKSRLNINKALEIVSALEAHSCSTRNPAESYNQFTREFRRRLLVGQLDAYQVQKQELISQDEESVENFQDLAYLLVKSHIIISSTINNEKSDDSQGQSINSITNQRLDKLIESLKRSEAACWSSSALWNNLGVCYLMKKRLIYCFSCLMKAYLMEPLDWRINYNLSIVCLKMGISCRALTFALAAKNLYSSLSRLKISSNAKSTGDKISNNPLITTQLACCFDSLGQLNQARRLYIESIVIPAPISGEERGRINSPSTKVNPNAIISYLIFLHKQTIAASDKEHHLKLKIHLLNQLEQSWLLRDQFDPQFSEPKFLEAATQIAKETFDEGDKFMVTRKTYAWTKVDTGIL